MAISKKRKEELVEQYVEWLDRSRAVFLTEYVGLPMKEIDGIREKSREVGGEFHIIKNTLGQIAFERLNMELPKDFLEGSTAIAFAFDDAPAMAKVMTEFAKSSAFIKLKGGYLDKHVINVEMIKMLAELPPLPVMRAQLLGTIMAPASKLARLLAEPARQLAAVFKAYADKDAPQEAPQAAA